MNTLMYFKLGVVVVFAPGFRLGVRPRHRGTRGAGVLGHSTRWWPCSRVGSVSMGPSGLCGRRNSSLGSSFADQVSLDDSPRDASGSRTLRE